MLIMQFIENFIKQFFKNSLIFYFIFFITLSFYIRLDAELLIFWSVLLVLFTVWSSLSDFLANILNIKTTLFYFYFIRFYQGRLWFIFLSYKFFSSNLFILKLPFFFKWFKLYTKRVFQIFNNLGFEVLNNWDTFINYYYFCLVQSLVSLIWLSIYKSLFNLNFSKEIYLKLNSRKIAEYVLLNKKKFAF